jgi:hypothetical protein
MFRGLLFSLWRGRNVRELTERYTFARHKALIAAIREQVEPTPAVVVIDTFNRAIGGDENNPGDVARFVRAADAIRAAFGCAVIVVHHCGHDGSRPRGHTSLPAASDVQVAVIRDAQTGVIVSKLERMKDDEPGAEIVSKLDRVDLGTDDDGDPITSCVILPAEGGARRKVKLSDNAQLALDALKCALADHGEKPPASNHIPQQPDIRACPVEIFRSYYYKLKIGEPDTKQKAFVRAVEKLQSLHLIGIHGDLVWLPDMPDMARQAGGVSGDIYPDRRGHTL